MARLSPQCLLIPKLPHSFSVSSSLSSSHCEHLPLFSVRRHAHKYSSNGVLQPFRELGWWQWMYRLSPYTYLIEGLLGQAIGRQTISCSSVELVPVNPPSGQTCGAYLDPFISFAGGYVTNPDATSACMYCEFRTTDEFLSSSFNIEWAHRWRNFGLMWAFIAFNVFAIYAFTYIFRIQKGNLFRGLAGRLRRRRS